MIAIREPTMTDQPFDPAACVDAAASLIGLPIAAEHRPGVILNLERIAQMAAPVMEFPLDDADEPAPVFRP
jgi:hypothetical protein